MAQKRSHATPTVQIDNDKIIVTKWRFPPGAETGWHRHNYDYVVVPQTTGQLRLETKDGEKTAQLETGISYFRNAGVEHNVVNPNDYTFTFVEIEVKQRRT